MDEAAPTGEKKYKCEKCHDTGWIYWTDEKGYSFGKECECQKVEKARRIFENSGILNGQRDITFKAFQTFDNPVLVNAKEKAVRYFQNFEALEKEKYNSILLCGQVGAGKTHLGIALSNNLITRMIAVIYMPYRNVITALKQNITNDEVYNRELSKYLNARVLYIDDMLKGRITESDVNIMFEIVNHRYLNQLPMIVTTEKTVDELLAFDEAVGSRIIEMCKGNIIFFPKGMDLNYRLRGAV